MLSEIIAKCPCAKFTITSHFQVSDIAGDPASGNGSGPIKKEQIFAVRLRADPGSRTKGETARFPCRGAGAIGCLLKDTSTPVR